MAKNNISEKILFIIRTSATRILRGFSDLSNTVIFRLSGLGHKLCGAGRILVGRSDMSQTLWCRSETRPS